MHFADFYEAVSDIIPSKTALIHGDVKRTWAETDDRAARLANALQQAGLSAGAKVGFYLYNGNEYVEAYYATLKIRGAAVNINYRYVEKELEYLLDYSDAEALFFHSSLGDRVASVLERLPQLKLLIEVDDDGVVHSFAQPYKDVIANNQPAERIERFSEDVFMNFTGGTTGMPKGVVYNIGDLAEYYLDNLSMLAPGGQLTLTNAQELAAFAKGLHSHNMPMVSLPACPLMHTAGLMSGLLSPFMCGGTVVTLQSRSFKAQEMLETIDREKVTFTVIVGDAFCLPILEELDKAKAEGRPYDLTSLKIITSSGVAWSAESKNRLLEYGDFQLMDGMGATEGSMGMAISSRAAPPGTTGKFAKMPATKVFNEDWKEVEPGSGEIGMIGAGGKMVPVAYYKDPEKTAATFREIDGKRYAFTGDMGEIAADGTLTVHGRGSGCINTAGEKVFPEEVENVLNTHPDVTDCVVLGMPHERFGQCVAAIIAIDAATISKNPDLADNITAFCRQELAGYKCPRVIKLQQKIERGPNGKVDYKWAKQLLNIS